MKANKPKKSAEEKALAAAQVRELSRQDEAINERKRRIIRAQTTSRASMLSGNIARSQQPGGAGTGGGGTGIPGRTGGGRGSSPGLGGGLGFSGSGRRRAGGGQIP